MSNLIAIRGDGANLSLEIVKFERPNSTNVDDANWLASQLKVRLKHFSCEMNLSLTTYDIAQLRSELESCLEERNGTARLRRLEPVLQLDLVFDGRGHVSVVGVAQTVGLRKTDLSFSFDSDHSCLAETSRQLQATCVNFPVQDK